MLYSEEVEHNILENIKMQGQGIVYGQEIQLRHIYSNCLLTLNSQVLAKQNGCVEVMRIIYIL